MADALMPVSGSAVTNSHHCTNTLLLLQDAVLGRRQCQSETRDTLLAGTSNFHGPVHQEAFLLGRKVAIMMTDAFCLGLGKKMRGRKCDEYKTNHCAIQPCFPTTFLSAITCKAIFTAMTLFVHTRNSWKCRVHVTLCSFTTWQLWHLNLGERATAKP